MHLFRIANLMFNIGILFRGYAPFHVSRGAMKLILLKLERVAVKRPHVFQQLADRRKLVQILK